MIFRTRANRFRERARASGQKNALPFWEESTEQVPDGRFSEHLPLSINGDLPQFSSGAANVAFRFGFLRVRSFGSSTT